MKKPTVFVTSLAAVLAATLPAAPALADDFPSAISVSGEANISVAPDLAQIDAGVASDAKTAKEASDANNAAMGKVLLALKGAGLAEKDYQTSRLSLQPQYGQNKSTGASPVVGFRASNRVTVKIRDVTKVAGIIDTLVAAGANDIGNISFEVTQASKLLDDAREQAVADARRKAEVYAKATGVTLGAPLSISEGGTPMPLFQARMAKAPMAAPAAVAPGEETLSVTVNVSWAIKAKEQ
ncbi:SIMPL domain-containing protein [Bradyrhizobium sp. 138]|uniref:SIMPL domain-containing protein n=1 Tax=Bradyrhizobium sp. 138 TaxID=2782615 RepID=UPI001FFB0108|nr:SIMPL domain-containing protein [Bradyrhizobium sp. 138]MCK1738059.1 SIMPL domain-containing protein [Bradyrhizobium sp. 138]